MTDRAQLVAAVRHAATGPAMAQAVAALDCFDRQRIASLQQDRELDLAAGHVTAALTPVPIHERHTAATDWLGEIPPPSQDFRTAMIAEATRWYRSLDPAVRGDGEELAEQARGRAQHHGSQYGHLAPQASAEFLSVVGYLHGRQAASGLPQIDQTIDPNNAPAPTPYPTEVFETFGPPQNAFNAPVESEGRQSQISSEMAPQIQQIEQQNSSGSGFGSGPERPDLHTTRFDTSNSYSELPPGSPGTISTGAPGQGPSVPSTPNPIAGQPQDATNPGQSGPQDDDENKRRTASEGCSCCQAHSYADKPPGDECPRCGHMNSAHSGRTASLVSAGYTAPDPFGFRWVTAAGGSEGIQPPLHERCASVHWPEQPCGRPQEHTASAAVGYVMNRDDFARIAAAEAVGADEGRRALQVSRGSLSTLGRAHNAFTAAWQTSARTAEDTAVLHGYMATVRPVLAGDGCTCGPNGCKGSKCAQCRNGECPKARTAAGRAPNFNGGRTAAMQKGAPFAGYKDFADCVAKNSDKDNPEAYCGSIKHRVEGASSLPQIQQVTDPNNAPDLQGDQLNPGVMFPIDPAFAEEWVTGPGGAQPRGGAEKEAARQNGAPTGAVQMFGRMDAMEGKDPHHKDSYPFSVKAHGQYLRGWNEIRGMQDVDRDPIDRQRYGEMTGRPDLHAHYLEARDSYGRTRGDRQRLGSSDSGVGTDPESGHCTDCGHRPGCSCPHECSYSSSRKGARRQANGAPMGDSRPAETLPGGEKVGDQDADRWSEHVGSRRTADTLSRPHQSTDDFAPPFNSAATTPPPPDGDYERGRQEGSSDAAAGEHPAFADNSSTVSPYVKGYAEGYSSAPQGAGQPDVPRSMGGDSGQARNAEEAATAFQVARASLTAGRHSPPGTPCPHCSGTTDDHEKDCEAWVYASLRPVARDFSQSEREQARAEGDTLPGTTKLPVENAQDLKNAERLKGKVKGEPASRIDAYLERKRKEFGKAAFRVSAAFLTPEAVENPEFARGYRYARGFRRGSRLMALGSAAFEAGVYAGITDNPAAQLSWTQLHRQLAGRHPVLSERLEAHASFTHKVAAARPDTLVRGIYVQAARPGQDAVFRGSHLAAPNADYFHGAHDFDDHTLCGMKLGQMSEGNVTAAMRECPSCARAASAKTAGTSVDLVTDGPGTSPDPAGSTPINGPGTPPPMGGRSDPNKAAGPPPYQGAQPAPQGPVVPDDVMGQPQEPAQPDGPLGQGFSGPGPGYGDGQDLAPGAPNTAASPGYSNPDAYRGSPRGSDKAAAFRATVQASLQQLRREAALTGSPTG